MQQYIDNIKRILEHGDLHPDRSGKGRISCIGLTEVYDLQKGFPLVTTRFVPFKNVVRELLWFISGGFNINDAKAPTFIWNKWAVDEQSIEEEAKLEQELLQNWIKEQPASSGADHSEMVNNCIEQYKQARAGQIGSIGPMYGPKWRNFPAENGRFIGSNCKTLADLPSDKVAHWRELFEEYSFLTQTKETAEAFENFCFNHYTASVDQLNELVFNLRNRPFSSRHVVTAWDPQTVPPETLRPRRAVLRGFGSLAPCHAMFQCFVREKGAVRYLDLQMYQRSADYPVGRPFNIAQYALLTHLLAHCTGMVPGMLYLPTGDAHLYTDQVEKAKMQVERTPLELPQLKITAASQDLFAIVPDDIQLLGYTSHEKIDYEVSE